LEKHYSQFENHKQLAVLLIRDKWHAAGKNKPAEQLRKYRHG